MNKWIYLAVSCIFIFLIVLSFPIVKNNFTGWNMYLFILFVGGVLLSLWQFIRKVIYSAKAQTNMEKEFTPVID